MKESIMPSIKDVNSKCDTIFVSNFAKNVGFILVGYVLLEIYFNPFFASVDFYCVL